MGVDSVSLPGRTLDREFSDWSREAYRLRECDSKKCDNGGYFAMTSSFLMRGQCLSWWLVLVDRVLFDARLRLSQNRTTFDCGC